MGLYAWLNQCLHASSSLFELRWIELYTVLLYVYDWLLFAPPEPVFSSIVVHRRSANDSLTPLPTALEVFRVEQDDKGSILTVQILHNELRQILCTCEVPEVEREFLVDIPTVQSIPKDVVVTRKTIQRQPPPILRRERQIEVLRMMKLHSFDNFQSTARFRLLDVFDTFWLILTHHVLFRADTLKHANWCSVAGSHTPEPSSFILQHILQMKTINHGRLIPSGIKMSSSTEIRPRNTVGWFAAPGTCVNSCMLPVPACSGHIWDVTQRTLIRSFHYQLGRLWGLQPTSFLLRPVEYPRRLLSHWILDWWNVCNIGPPHKKQ